MILGTNVVTNDEACLGLYEMNLQSVGNKGFHRYQILHVVRNDRTTEYREDLGVADNFKGIDQIRIPGGVRNELTGKFEIVETVGSLRDIAAQVRGRPPFDKRELASCEHIRN